MNDRLFGFAGGDFGDWAVRQHLTIRGEPLASAKRVFNFPASQLPAKADWVLLGVSSHDRYVERTEKSELLAVQEGLGRPEATYAALIPIRKSAAWWAMTQDERRSVFEAQSRHIAIGMRYLPAIARKLHHCRDLESVQPFDFITWFEYAPENEAVFDAMLFELRASPEWRYIDREIDIRLERA